MFAEHITIPTSYDYGAALGRVEHGCEGVLVLGNHLAEGCCRGTWWRDGVVWVALAFVGRRTGCRAMVVLVFIVFIIVGSGCVGIECLLGGCRGVWVEHFGQTTKRPIRFT